MSDDNQSRGIAECFFDNCKEEDDACRHPSCDLNDCSKCNATAYQPIKCCVNVSVTPCAICDPPTVSCCGDPEFCTPSACNDYNDTSATFTIKQLILVKLPVRFGAHATIGDAKFNFGKKTFRRPECD